MLVIRLPVSRMCSNLRRRAGAAIRNRSKATDGGLCNGEFFPV